MRRAAAVTIVGRDATQQWARAVALYDLLL
jgi:hypothetical protein